MTMWKTASLLVLGLLLALPVCSSGGPAPQAPEPLEARPVNGGVILERTRARFYTLQVRIPAQAVAAPELLDVIRARAQAAEEEIRSAVGGAASEDELGMHRPGHDFRQQWRVEVETPRLLLLSSSADWRGERHIRRVEQLLWDRELRRLVTTAELFSEGEAMVALIRDAACNALRRRAPSADCGALLPHPPELRSDRGGRIVRLQLRAVEEANAGSMSDLVFAIAVTPDLLRRVRPAYAEAFEPAAQRQ